MDIIVLQALGVAVFLVGSAWLGRRVRRNGAASGAEGSARASHVLFWSCLVLPGLLGVFHPGLGRYDDITGLPSLPFHPVTVGLGALALAAGVLLMAASNHALVSLGRGSAAFLLTREVVGGGVYRWTRNPMSLGFYLACVGVGLLAGSLTVTLGALLIVVPAHLFNLRYFEERELELRFGSSYLAYKQRVPFLLPGIPPGEGGG